jgi:hypothetical protein
MLIATGPLLPVMVSVLAAPVVATILLLAFKGATNRRERLRNLLLGGAGSVAAALTLIFLSAPRPNTWFDNNAGLCMVAVMIVGAAFGISIGAWVRRRLACRQPRPRAGPTTHDAAGPCAPDGGVK